MRARPLVLLAVTAASLAVMTAPASAATRPHRARRAHAAGVGTDIAGAFAAKLATAGASYMITHLKAGALGETGKSIGSFLSDVGLGDPNAPLLEEFKAVNAKLDSLTADVGALSTKLDQLGAAQASGTYAILVAHANRLRSSVITEGTRLRSIAAAPVHERPALAQEFVSFYDANLAGHELEFENYLTGGGVPGADGIIQLSSRRAKSAAQPFFTHTMSMFPREVINEYMMVQATWLEEELNVLHYKKAPKSRVEEAIFAAEQRLNREWAKLPPAIVFPNTVVDTRTNLMWTWRIDGRSCDGITGNAPYNTCMYALGHNASKFPYDSKYYSSTSTEPTNGSPPPGWKRPTPDQVKTLDAGSSGGVASWLSSRGGFPASMTGEVWTSTTNATQAQTVNQANGAVVWRNRTESHYTLLQGESAAQAFWYWLP
jgi:hypothetical protein